MSAYSICGHFLLELKCQNGTIMSMNIKICQTMSNYLKCTVQVFKEKSIDVKVYQSVSKCVKAGQTMQKRVKICQRKSIDVNKSQSLSMYTKTFCQMKVHGCQSVSMCIR